MLNGEHITIVARFLTILFVLTGALLSDAHALPLRPDLIAQPTPMFNIQDLINPNAGTTSGTQANTGTSAQTNPSAGVSINKQATDSYNTTTKDSVVRQIMRAGSERTYNMSGRYGTESGIAQLFSLPPLPGDQGFADSNDDPERFLKESGAIPDLGANNTKSVNIVLPPLKGLQQIMNSTVTKNLLKDLTASESAVLMQTYMMVENGAATGFMGSMNIGSNLMSNLLDAQDYQLKLLDASDDTGKMKKAYVARVAQEMQSGSNKDVWPAALYIASGEDGKKAQETMQDLSGKKAYDLGSLTAANGGSPLASGASSKDSQLFTELLFVNNTGGGGASTSTGSLAPSSGAQASSYKNEQLDALKKDFRELFGDVEIRMSSSGPSKYARNVDLNFIAPKADEKGRRRGVAKVNWEEVQVVWQNLHVILAEYCVWKQSNPNANKEVFDMETDATTAAIGKIDAAGNNPWELAGAPDMPMTMNVIQILYKMYEQTKRTSDVKCSEFGDLANPQAIPDQESQNNGAANLNDCGPGKGCLRNRVALQISYLVARSRTLHTYRSLFSIAGRFATDPFSAELMMRVSARAFAGMNLDDELKSNYARYKEFIAKNGQYEQGKTPGSAPRPGMNEAIQPGRIK
jgi:hypothetical protein